MLDFLPLDRLPENLAYLVYSLRQIETVFDLLLVSLTYFGILILVRRSQAAVLLRGILVLALFAVGVSALLRLPTFTWVLRVALILGLIATPLIFQPELRRGLERLGRSLGFLQIRPTELVHRVVPVLLRVTSNLSQRRVGGLIVLEGTTELNDVIGTGVPLHAELSADLLETIFQDKTPLHDGAVVVREDRIAAAACVLPLSEQALPDGMHQGTRHRAALGISEKSNCLAVVVSEETGDISVAENGLLHRNLDSTELREYLHRFYDPMQASSSGLKGLIAIRRSNPPPKRAKRAPRAVMIELVWHVRHFADGMPAGCGDLADRRQPGQPTENLVDQHDPAASDQPVKRPACRQRGAANRDRFDPGATGRGRCDHAAELPRYR